MADNGQKQPNHQTSNNESQLPECEETIHNRQRDSVRRKLDFGPLEEDEDLIRRLQGEDHEIEKRKAVEKWNFDFENEVPLPGDWEWEKISNNTNVPNSTDVIIAEKERSKKNRNI